MTYSTSMSPDVGCGILLCSCQSMIPRRLIDSSTSLMEQISSSGWTVKPPASLIFCPPTFLVNRMYPPLQLNRIFMYKPYWERRIDNTSPALNSYGLPCWVKSLRVIFMLNSVGWVVRPSVSRSAPTRLSTIPYFGVNFNNCMPCVTVYKSYLQPYY